ncbi:MAG TPA: hemolysin family protein [Actinomycetales bacterium]|nr:hemolysin family protein [Actinomycetales bacterium]
MVETSIPILALIAAGASLMGAVLTAGETALLRTTRSMAQELTDEQHRKARVVTALVTDPGPATVAARRLHVITDAILAASLTLLSASIVRSWWLTLLIAAGLVAGITWILIGVIPRRLARRYPAQTLSALGPMLAQLAKLNWGSHQHHTAAHTEDQQLRPELAFSEDELRDMVDRISELEAIEETEREMIHSVFELGDTYTREVMVPRTAMITIDHDVPLRKAMSLFLRSGFSRIPVIRDSEDDVVGILYFKDVVRRLHADPGASKFTAERIGRPATFVPESKPVDDLLRQMQREANHVAIVVDEYGGTAGMVTIEDALEEIVGELVDEHDRAEQEIEQLEAGLMRVPARMSLHDLGESLDLRLEDEEVDSVGGLLAKALGKVPLPGQHAQTNGLYLEAERTEGRRKQLSTLLIRVLEAEPDLPTPARGEDERITEESSSIIEGPTGEATAPHPESQERK